LKIPSTVKHVSEVMYHPEKMSYDELASVYSEESGKVRVLLKEMLTKYGYDACEVIREKQGKKTMPPQLIRRCHTRSALGMTEPPSFPANTVSVGNPKRCHTRSALGMTEPPSFPANTVSVGNLPDISMSHDGQYVAAIALI